jgi:nucleoside-diphosphate-sugar epimerase
MVWARVFDVYGPGEHPSRLSTFVVRRLLAGRPAELTHGSQIRDYTYVDDVAEGLVSALKSRYVGETDIASGRPVSVRDLALEIARQLGREDLLRFGIRPSPVPEFPVVLGDAAHAKASIGWEPRRSLEIGVAALVEWERRVLRDGDCRSWMKCSE